MMNVSNVGYVDVDIFVLFSLLFNLSAIHVCIFCRSGSHTHTHTHIHREREREREGERETHTRIDKHSTTTVSLQSLVVPAEQSPIVLYPG